MHQECLKGQIFYSTKNDKNYKPLMHFHLASERMSLDKTLMHHFHCLNLNSEEKRLLSRKNRHMISHFMDINIFHLKSEVESFIVAIEKCPEDHLIIHAHGYGAYIAIAALYTHTFTNKKSLEIKLYNSPLALFPKAFNKTTTRANHIKVHYQTEASHWLFGLDSLTKSDVIQQKNELNHRKKVS